jgi:hypothetical protein
MCSRRATSDLRRKAVILIECDWSRWKLMEEMCCAMRPQRNDFVPVGTMRFYSADFFRLCSIVLMDTCG